MKITYALKRKLKFIFYIKWKLVSKYIDFDKKKNVKKSILEKNTSNLPLHGSFYIFSKDYFEKENEAFYNKTFMYMESYILHHIAMKKGYRMEYIEEIKVDHYEDYSTDKSYSDGYNKAIFTNQCMYDSITQYLELLKKENIQ